MFINTKDKARTLTLTERDAMALRPRNSLCHCLSEEELLEVLSWLTFKDVTSLDDAMEGDIRHHSYFLGLLRRGKKEFTLVFDNNEYENDHLQLIGCVNGSDDVLEWLSLRRIPIVKFSCPFHCSDRHLELLSNMSAQLKSVEINCIRTITDQGLKALSRASASSLRSITLQGYPTHITSEGLLDLSRCSNIATFHLNSHAISGEGLHHITRLSYLEVLDLNGCYELTDDALRGMRCPLLTTLQLRGCKQVTHEGLRFISEGCQSLAYLDIRCCDQIENTALEFISRCRSLRHLDVTSCSVTDKGLMHLSQGCALLKYLNVDNCYGITSVGMMHLANGCPSLEHLSVRFCDITDEGLLFLSQGCTALKVLNFCRFHQPT